jgi:short-subunit dehydrogenase
MTRIVIIGATSTIAVHCARLWAAGKAEFVLAGRNMEKLASVAADLKARGAQAANCHVLDVTDVAAQRMLMAAIFADGASVDIALVAHGELPDEAACDGDPAAASKQFTINATSTIALVSALGVRLRAQGRGTVAVISSVAGDRGRASNAHYGAAKAAVSTFCDGLRARLRDTGVHVLTIKPGIVATPMTSHLDVPGILMASPVHVARDICRAIDRKRTTLYTPWWWGWIMLAIRLIPEPLFVRLKM